MNRPGGVQLWCSARSRITKNPDSLWFAQDGYLTTLLKSDLAYLLLDRPLAGTFEFSVDVWHGPGAVGYGDAAPTEWKLADGATTMRGVLGWRVP